jgi:hypothetical protein
VSAVAHQPRMLGSWKEIASYFGKGVRTVQRWEHQFGLPVMRPNGSAKGMVCASPEELDRWFRMRWGQRTGKPASPHGGAAREAVHASLQTSLELRNINMQLMADLMRSVRGVAAECRALAGRSTRSPKSNGKD